MFFKKITLPVKLDYCKGKTFKQIRSYEILKFEQNPIRMMEFEEEKLRSQYEEYVNNVKSRLDEVIEKVREKKIKENSRVQLTEDREQAIRKQMRSAPGRDENLEKIYEFLQTCASGPLENLGVFQLRSEKLSAAVGNYWRDNKEKDPATKNDP